MTTTKFMQSLFDDAAASRVTVEAKARAMQAAYMGALIGRGVRAVVGATAKFVGGALGIIERNREVAHLLALDDRLLADIGLTRGTLVQHVVGGADALPADPASADVLAALRGTAKTPAAANQDHRSDRAAA